MRTSTATHTSSGVPLKRFDEDNEVEGRELVLRGGKLSPRSSPASDPSERQRRQPINPIPVSSARVDHKDGAQRVTAGNARIQNSTSAKYGSQTLENPSATNFLTNISSLSTYHKMADTEATKPTVDAVSIRASATSQRHCRNRFDHLLIQCFFLT